MQTMVKEGKKVMNSYAIVLLEWCQMLDVPVVILIILINTNTPIFHVLNRISSFHVIDILDNLSPVSVVCPWQKYHVFSQSQLRNWISVNQGWLCWKSSAKVIFMLIKGLNYAGRKRAFYQFSRISPITKGSSGSQRIKQDYHKSIKLLHLLLF